MEMSVPRERASNAAATPRPELICTTCSLHFGFAGEQPGAFDGFDFSEHRAGLKECRNIGAARGVQAVAQRLGDLFAFCVNRDGEAQPRGFAHALVECRIVGARKLRQA